MTSNFNFHPFQDGFSINSTNEGYSGSIGDRDKNSLVNDAEAITSGGTKNFFSLSFYQQYFDVDTDQVVKRVVNSVVPTHNNFILDFVQPLPDLWGPFWISVTLIFSIGVFGNISQFISSDGTDKDIVGSDFRLVTSATSLVFCYVLLVPLIVYGILWQRKSDLQYPYLDIVCAYGYSLAIFIPVSVLWVLNFNILRWILIFAAVTLSGGVLAKAIYPAFKNDTNKLVAFGSIAGILLLHFLLALCFKVYFFDAAHPLKTDIVPEITGNASGLASSQVLPPQSAAIDKAPDAKVRPEEKTPGEGPLTTGTNASKYSLSTTLVPTTAQSLASATGLPTPGTSKHSATGSQMTSTSNLSTTKGSKISSSTVAVVTPTIAVAEETPVAKKNESIVATNDKEKSSGVPKDKPE